MKFFRRKSAVLPDNEAWRIGARAFLVHFAAVSGGALLTAAALPPWNWRMTPWFGLVPFLLVLFSGRGRTAWFYSWWWGTLYAFAGFYWLYEIHPVIPYLIAPVFGCYFIPFGVLMPFFYRWWLITPELRARGYEAMRVAPSPAWWRETGLVATVAAAFVLTEYLRWHVLPWNNLSVTQWRNAGLIGLCAITGTYGISFLIVTVNAALALTILELRRSKGRYRRSWAMIFAIALLLIAFAAGLYAVRPPERMVSRSFTLGVIQPNPEQRRIGMDAELRGRLDEAALAVNLALSRQVLASQPQLLVWPETTISMPLFANSPFAQQYQHAIQALIDEYQVPILLGTADWELLPPDVKRLPEMTNTAYLLGRRDGAKGIRMLGRYDKNQLVPFGEYVPFRFLLPRWIADSIEMGRDMKPGGSLDPLQLPLGFRVGVNICFEDIFPRVAREEVRRGADFLLVITNDSWYPESAEQAQHLANSVFRAVETGVPMVRCGSNSGSVLVRPDGKIETLNNLDPLRQTRSAGLFTVKVPTVAPRTIAVRFGDWWVGCCALLVAGGLLFAAGQWRRYQQLLRERSTKEDGTR